MTGIIPQLKARTLLGLKIGVVGTATYITDNEVVYPAAGVLVLHNFEQRHQRFLKLHDKEHVNILTVSPNRKFVVVGETGDKASISGYDLNSLKRKKALSLPPETTAREIVSMTFTHDGKYLVVLTGEPDWTLLYYNWEKSRLESSTRAINANDLDSRVTQVCCNPTDNSVVCIVGPGIFRLLGFTEGSWRQFGFQNADSFLISCACWLTFDRVLVGTSDDQLLLVEGGELKNSFKASAVDTINMKLKDEALVLAAMESTDPIDFEIDLALAKERKKEVREIISFSRGFAYACGSGTVHLFEKETNHKFTKRNLFQINCYEFREAPTSELNNIQTLCVNSSETELLATAERCQMYSVPLWGPDLNHSPVIMFNVMGQPLHYGPVKDMAVCVWKPLLVTVGQVDRSVRVWNYEEDTMEMVKQYPEDIQSISLHPTGLYLLIGSTDVLRFTLLLIDDIQTVRSFPIRMCPVCRFSVSGHQFAAVTGNIILVYSSITCENLFVLKGHKGRVTSLLWTVNDNRMVTCGSEGALYEWDVATQERLGEVVSLECRYTGCAATADGNFIYGLDADGNVAEIQSAMVVHTAPLNQGPLGHLLLSRSNQMMFVTTPTGALLSLKFPIPVPPEFIEYNIHSRAITKICISYDDQTVMTAATDGTICFWHLTHSEGKAVKMDKNFAYSKEVLVNKRDLEEKLRSIGVLTSRIDELETEHVYQMRQKDAANAIKMKEENDSFCVALEELKRKNEHAELDHQQELTLINSEITNLKGAHGSMVEAMESGFNERLIVEYDRYSDLEAVMKAMRDRYEYKLDELKEIKDAEISDLRESLTAKVADKTEKLMECNEESTQKAAEHEEIKRQIETDVDEELLEVRANYELLLQTEKDIVARQNGEINVCQKKFLGAQRESNEYCQQMHEMQRDLAKAQTIILSLERDSAELMKEIKERDGSLAEKERRIYELKQLLQESEKFKVVLDHKIMELKSMMEPKDRELMENRNQIRDMELELKVQHKLNANTNLAIQESRRKLFTVEQELVAEHKNVLHANATLQRIRIDLHDASGVIQDEKKLRGAVRHMYHAYSDGSQRVTKTVEAEEAQQEFMRQRHHLEKTIATLKQQVTKKAVAIEAKPHLMEENVNLLQEVNTLRRELKVNQRRVRDMESILGVNGNAYTKPWVAQARLKLAVKTKQDIVDECTAKIVAGEKSTAMLNDEVSRLIKKLPKPDRWAHRRDQQELHKALAVRDMKSSFISRLKK